MEVLIFLLCGAITILYYTLTKKIQDTTRLAKHEQDRLLLSLEKYEGLRSREEFEKQLNSNIHARETEIAAKESILANLSEEQKAFQLQIDKLRHELGDLEEEATIQSFGFYQPKYNFINSGDYSIRLEQVKNNQKDMIRGGSAAICRTSWAVKGSEKEGKKLATNSLKLVLTIFNGECDSIISKVKPSNAIPSEEKIKKRFKNLNKSVQVLDCDITEEYLRLKIRELHLQYEFECKRQEEKEREQELKARLKQDSIDPRKLEEESKKIQEAEERERIYQQQLQEVLLQKQQLQEVLLQKDIDTSQDKKLLEEKENQIEEKENQIRQLLAEATKGREEAENRSRLEKAGYIYVISNIGSLGRDIYRICMTKRSSNEDEYVRTMTPDVPFPFDIHFKFISEDASDTLRRLYQRFDERRVNAVNPRREFFRASFDEISQAIEEVQKETGALKNIQSERSPQAYEYRRTQAAERDKEKISDT